MEPNYKQLKENFQLFLEYGNQGPSIPKSYLVKKDKTFKEIPFSEVSKITNLIYDMGGGETSYYDEYNVVVIDNFPVEKFAEGLNDNSNAEKKLYVMYNLEKPYSFPKANKIIIAQLVYNLKNISNFAETVNNSLKPNGKIEFFSDMMFKEDKEFIKILTEKYNFVLPQGVDFKSLSKHKSETLTLQKGKSFIPPPEVLSFEIKNKISGEKAVVTYTKNGKSWLETIDGSQEIKDDFYEKNGKPSKWMGMSSKKENPIGVNSDEMWYHEDTINRKKYTTIRKIS